MVSESSKAFMGLRQSCPFAVVYRGILNLSNLQTSALADLKSGYHRRLFSKSEPATVHASNRRLGSFQNYRASFAVLKFRFTSDLVHGPLGVRLIKSP